MVLHSLRLVLVALVLAVAGLGPALAQSKDLAALNRRAEELYRAGRYAEAMPFAKRALALAERVRRPGHLDIGNAVNRVALIYTQQGRYADAEPLYKRVLAIKEKALGAEHPEIGNALHGLAVLYVQQGRYPEAEPLYKRALVVKEKGLGLEHVTVGATLYALATLYVQQGRYQEAEPLYKRALAIHEKVQGPEHTEVGTILYGLAALYVYIDRYEDAEPLYRRSLAIKEKALGPDHTEVGSALHNLAVLFVAQDRYQEAEPLYKRVLTIKEKVLGPEHTEIGSVLYGLAQLYARNGRSPEAEPLYKRVLSIKEKALGAEHSEVATTLFGLAGIYAFDGRYAEAEPLYKRVLAIKLKALGPDHPDVGITFDELASLHFNQGQWAEAAANWRQSTQLVIRRTQRGTELSSQNLTGRAMSETQRTSHRFAGLVKVSNRLAGLDAASGPDLALDMFEAVQWAQTSQAATSLAQMAARQAKGAGLLADLARERQDLVEDWQDKDKALVVSRSEPPQQRNAQAEAAFAARLAQIDARLAEIDKILTKDFPDYASLANPRPLSIHDAQDLLHDDEALLLTFDTDERLPTPEETFIWVVTKSGARWVKSTLGTKSLADHVAALRCGLDAMAWEQAESRCADLLGATASSGTVEGLPPLDLGRAHALYQALFGQVEDLIKDKHLLLVASGPLTALPFHVLVTEPPATPLPAEAGGYADEAWLAKRHAVTVLPSVGSLLALRKLAKASKATQPFIGFGNPLLSGPSASDRSAWARQGCPQGPLEPLRVAARKPLAPTSRFALTGLADVDLIRRQAPLPETADELCAVARSAGAPEAAVHLGDQATEAAVKALSANGALGNARIVHFATHGLLAGETGMVSASKAEPALLLTPPSSASENDDGLFTASEVTQLKLDADWVVLSACNTAAGGGDLGSEALSGLARAFIYAGARAMLVSHWAVDSQATVSLVTKAFDALKADPMLGRSAALQRSMLALIATGGRNAHPANWAPFVVVGEGAR